MRNIRNILAIAVILLLIAVSISGCTSPTPAASPTPAPSATPGAQKTVTITDYRGKEITVPYPTTRVVFLVENAMNTMYAVGGKDAIVGIGDIWMPQYKEAFFRAVDPGYDSKLRVASKDGAVDLESLAKTNPQLVVLWSADWDDKDTKAIEETLKVPVYGVFLDSFSDLDKLQTDFAKIIGNDARGRQANDQMNAEIKKITDVSKTIPEGQKPTVYWMWGDIYGTAGLNSTANDLINAAGGVNVLSKWDNNTKYDEHPVLTMEAIAALNPDVIYMWYNDKLSPQDIMTGADFQAWRNLNAVKNGRVYELDDPFMYDFMTARLPVAMMKVAKDINPETFKSWDLNKEYDAYFVEMYGVHYPGFAKA